MYILYVFSFFFFSSNLSAQDTKPNGYNIFYHSNGEIASEGLFKNGLPNGIWKSYSNKGILISEGKKLKGLSDSIWTFYDTKGLVKNKIEYFNDKKNGCAIYFDTLGFSIKELFYVNNIIENEQIEYYQSGKIKSIINFVDGKKIGDAFEYSEDGIIITELIFNDGFLKSKKEINRYNKDGLKTGYWRDFYSNGKLKSESNFDNGVKKGISKQYNSKGKIETIKNFSSDTLNRSEDIELIDLYKEYYPNTYKEKLIGGFYNGMKQGMYREYDRLGNLINGYIYKNDTIIAEGLLLNDGTYDGKWTTNYSNGQLKSEGIYENGSKNGLWTFYYENGKKQQIGKYKNQIPSGEWKWFYKNGGLKRIEYYRKGKLEGSQIEYDNIGNEITNGEFYNGLKEGAWFYHLGDFKETGEFTMGYKTNRWNYFYKSGKLAFIGDFDEGQPKGQHVYYYENGVKKLKGKYLAGEKNGTWKKYNSEGELIEYLKYNRGELLKINGQKIKVIANE